MNKKVLLKVEHLEQHFKLGKNTLKAVDDVSFEIYEGEVLGLVGESGCGKTTTGRSIIRLYDITGGSVYFDGKRICAGIGTYKRKIQECKQALKSEVSVINAAHKARLSELDMHKDDYSREDFAAKKEALISAYKEEVKVVEDKYLTIIEEQTALIKSAVHDHKKCNKEFALYEVEKVKEEYLPKLESVSEEEKPLLEAEYKDKLALAKKARITSQIQMIFQDPIASLDPRMTVHDIIAEGLIIRGEKNKEKIEKEVFRVLRLVGLVPEHASRYPHEFSGGQRQRIGVARAIILNPKLIIADEPVSALDVSIQAQVINLLNELRAKMGLTTLFIAHDLSVVKYFSDRIAVMYFGKIVELASSDELFNNPLHPYTKSLLSAIPLPDPKFEKRRKRIAYNPLEAHDYSVDKPSLKEVSPGHFVYCNEIEYNRLIKESKGE